MGDTLAVSPLSGPQCQPESITVTDLAPWTGPSLGFPTLLNAAIVKPTFHLWPRVAVRRIHSNITTQLARPAVNTRSGRVP